MELYFASACLLISIFYLSRSYAEDGYFQLDQSRIQRIMIQLSQRESRRRLSDWRVIEKYNGVKYAAETVAMQWPQGRIINVVTCLEHCLENRDTVAMNVKLNEPKLCQCLKSAIVNGKGIEGLLREGMGLEHIQFGGHSQIRNRRIGFVRAP